MIPQKVTIVEGKRDFTRIVKKVSEDAEDIIITKRGKPVVVLLCYREYKEMKRLRSYLKMLQISESLKKYQITATQIYEESKKELERDEYSH
ncbi:MAG: type II toxin-antitoxin system Phd/YefM family antitoxin [Proteobacteria bacterium]|nr:type II toxin-antitoxin system Phd/YefM family antitoxin [Pseudomonadota bacterium]